MSNELIDGLLRIERAEADGMFIGLRLTIPEHGRTVLVFADQGAMPGFRAGEAFTPNIDEKIVYEDALEAKAAPVGELWAVHAQGPDDIYPAFSRDDAERHAAELNGLTMPEGIAISAVVIQSPLPAAEHWKCLAEQEREQCEAIQARAARQRQQATDWQPSGADYDRSIHSNPDAKAWSDFFVATFPGLSDKHELMLGWFANAMMAMHDHLKAQQAREVVAEELFDGQAVLCALSEKAKARTSAENVSDVLDAVVGLIRARLNKGAGIHE